MDDKSVIKKYSTKEFSELTGIYVSRLEAWHRNYSLRALETEGNIITEYYYTEDFIKPALDMLNLERENFIKKFGCTPEQKNLQRFMTAYRKIVDKNLLQSDKDKYLRKMKYVVSLVEKVDFKKNLLFTFNIKDANIGKEIFLNGLWGYWEREQEPKSYMLISPYDLVTINFTDKTFERDGVEPFPNIYSLDDIKHDILLIMITNRELENKNKCKYLLNVIENRVSGRIATASETRKLTWIFHLGTDSMLSFAGNDKKDESEYFGLYKMFTDKYSSDFEYHDLNIVHAELKKKEQEQKKD